MFEFQCAPTSGELGFHHYPATDQVRKANFSGNLDPQEDDYLGIPARTFKSFMDIAVDAGNSRFYGGTHYQPSIDAGLTQGGVAPANSNPPTANSGPARGACAVICRVIPR